jgi:3-methylcrotonyl-CoA carboxylase alpha subunit
MFFKLLVANRGEIACRVIRTARRLGIRTVAVYSEVDVGSLHVALADEAVLIGPAPARESYLSIDNIIDAVHRTGAEAVHPGYGFLAENAEFAMACADAGAVFVGPTAAAIRAMGSKSEAKRIMAEAGVPLVPGYHGEDQRDATLSAEAARIGFPVLIKAVAGGGGKGMRRVDRLDDLAEALAGARRESTAAFGDDSVLIEKYVLAPRHVELQVFADMHGNAVHVFERDCSIQRRHQKVIEEAPAPALKPELRRVMGEAAVTAARAIGYLGAGTVEFLLDPEGAFYFMEMNTRLQVEHPVSEMITGLDFVEWQLRIAAGERLPLTQDDITFAGHAIEARLYAEDPRRGFLPATGRLGHLRWPEASRHVRVDTGVRQGDEVTPHYDPLLAKLIVWDHDRAGAVVRLRTALAACRMAGVRNNVDFLRRIAEHSGFASAEVDTGFIERHRADLIPEGEVQPYVDAWVLACVDILLRQHERSREAAGQSADPWSPWSLANGWRLNGEGHSDIRLRFGGATHRIAVTYRSDGYLLDLPTGPAFVRGERLADGAIRIEVEGRKATGWVAQAGSALSVFTADATAEFEVIDPMALSAEVVAGTGHLSAPMPGKVVQIAVKPGDPVRRGAALMVLEAMKMEHTIVAPADGTVDKVFYGVGDLVEEGAELVSFAEAAE